MTDLSRRHLIQGAVAAGAALAGSTVAVASPKQKWDEVVDVIVIGSGFAGLAAAIEAKKAGANVVVLEKMATFGGNSIINGGILTATGCPQQKLHKIEDSVELLEKDILTAGNYMNYSSKVRYLAEHALSNYEWTVKVGRTHTRTLTQASCSRSSCSLPFSDIPSKKCISASGSRAWIIMDSTDGQGLSVPCSFSNSICM